VNTPAHSPNPEQLHKENQQLREQVMALTEQLKEALNKVAFFERQVFGSKSEKLHVEDGSSQMSLLAGLMEPPQPPPEEPTEEITYTHRKKARDNAVTDSGLRFDDSVPKEVIEVPAKELEGPGAEHYEIIDYKVTHRLAQRPGSYVILEYRRPVLKHKQQQTLTSPPTPENVLEKSVADVSFLAGMMVDKFVYHLPLYRQHQRLAQNGITLSRATLTQLICKGIELLRPIHEAQLGHSLETSRVLAMDETPIKAGRSKGGGKMHQGYLWPLYGDADEICFTYSPSRGMQHIVDILGERFKGVLLTDGYAAYERFAAGRPEVTHAQCWAHCRRGFERAKEAEPQASREALQIIAALFAQERTIRERELTGEDKLKWRTQHSLPVVQSFWAWMETQCRRHDLLPSNPLTKALKYAQERQEALQVFLSDPDVPLDTNHLERGLRPVPMGRKNWLFNWTELGAEHLAIVQSLLVTCRLHGIDPFTYLVDVLLRVGQHPANQAIELTPRLWKEHFADNPLRSDVQRLRNHASE
jgi:transposase